MTAVALGGLASGCGGGGSCGAGTIQAEWTINGQSAAATCAAVGATQVALTVDNSSSTTATFNCGAGTGQTPLIAPGAHNVSIALLAANGQVIDSLPATGVSVPCGGSVDVGVADFQAQTCDPPQIGATWTIDKQATGAALTCDQAAATMVELTLNGTPFDFPCSAGQGLTTTVAAGNYTADFVLLDGGGNVLSQTTQMTITVKSCGVTDVGDVLFDVQ